MAAIATREALRHRTRTPPASSGVEVEEIAEPDRQLETAVDRLWLARAVAHLEQRDRLVVLLHYRHDMTVCDIANATGMPLGTVKVKLQRARDKLRAELS